MGYTKRFIKLLEPKRIENRKGKRYVERVLLPVRQLQSLLDPDPNWWFSTRGVSSPRELKGIGDTVLAVTIKARYKGHPVVYTET